MYYRAVKGTPFKWLNIKLMCQFLLPKNQIVKIKDFTALISDRPNDPDKSTRQQVFLRALGTLPEVQIIYGYFLTHPKQMVLASSPPDKPSYVTVIKTEEKGSDVNLASHLVSDGY